MNPSPPLHLNFHVSLGGECLNVPTSVTITGQPGKYTLLVIDDYRSAETAYSSPMKVDNTDPLELVRLGLNQYRAWVQESAQ